MMRARYEVSDTEDGILTGRYHVAHVSGPDVLDLDPSVRLYAMTREGVVTQLRDLADPCGLTVEHHYCDEGIEITVARRRP